jgi:hypothetical protein
MTSCIHKMCGRTYGQTNMKRAITLTKINHPWNRYNMCMLKSWSIKIPNMNKMRQKKNHIGYLGWPWSEHAHIMQISRMVDFCESYSPFHVCLTIRPSAHLVYATSHFSFVVLRSWPIRIPNMNKMRQTTNDLSCVHKMCEWTYGQTNMKRAITLAKINHPWNWHNMRMLRSWSTKIPNMEL